MTPDNFIEHNSPEEHMTRIYTTGYASFLHHSYFCLVSQINIVLLWVSLPLLRWIAFWLYLYLIVFDVNSKAVLWILTLKDFEEWTKVSAFAMSFALLSPASLHNVLYLEHLLIWPAKAILNHFSWHKLVAALLQHLYFSHKVNTSARRCLAEKKTKKNVRTKLVYCLLHKPLIMILFLDSWCSFMLRLQNRW